MDFHDALLLDLAADFRHRRVVITVLAYPHQDSRDRKCYDLSFEDVSLFSTTVDLQEMKANEFAGTIVHLRGHQRDQTTKIFLTGGVILIRSKPMQMTERDHP